MTQSGPPVPLAEEGIARFEALANELPRLLDRLRRAPVWSSERDGPLPAVPGVYLEGCANVFMQLSGIHGGQRVGRCGSPHLHDPRRGR
jgi:hypothetical protein